MEGLAEVVLLILAASAGAGGVAGYYVGGPKHRVLGTLGGAAAGVGAYIAIARMKNAATAPAVANDAPLSPGANAQSPQQIAANAAIQGP